MSMNGGYKILDFKGIAFTSGTEKDAPLPGMYDTLEGTNRATLVSGLVIGNTEYDDMLIPFVVSSTSFVGYKKVSGGAITITVASDDGITCTYTADA